MLIQLRSAQQPRALWNPFNGIERNIKIVVAGNPEEWSENPFNGIESSLQPRSLRLNLLRSGIHSMELKGCWICT